jgi:hypothetical protein
MSREDGPIFEMACTFTGASTDKAVQIHDPATEEDFWIPLSQVTEMHNRKPGQRTDGTIVMTEWIAKQKGLL